MGCAVLLCLVCLFDLACFFIEKEERKKQARIEKEERKKQARSNKQTRQSNTAHPRQSLFLEKMSCLGWDSIAHTNTCTYSQC